MTIKELALFTGKTERTISRWIKKTCDILSDHDKESINQKIQTSFNTKNPPNFDMDEVRMILECGSMSKDKVLILMDNARKPTHTEIMTKWWKMWDESWCKVYAYLPDEFECYGLLVKEDPHYKERPAEFRSFVTAKHFIGRESADIPPEENN